METERLKQFCVIVDTGSFTQASRLLGITHSGLSKSMGTLEKELGHKLFQPHGRGVVITDKGKEIYSSAQDVVQRIETLKRGLETNPVSAVRLGVFEIFTTHFMGVLASKYLKNQGLECLEMSPGQIETSLVENRIDFGLTYVPVPHEGVEHLEIAKMSLSVYVQEGKFKNMAIEDIPFVTPSTHFPQNPLGVKERDGWPDSLFPRKKVYSTNLLSTALDLTQSGLCAIFIPDHLAEMHNQVTLPHARLSRVALPPQVPKIKRPVFLAKRIQSPESAEMKKVSRAVRELCSG